MLLDGLFLPLATPYLPDGRLNLPKLGENVGRYSKTPASGLVVLSRVGEPSLLSDAETRDALRCAADAAAAEKVLIAGIARDAAVHALEMIAFAAEAGYDVALVPLPSVLRDMASEREAISYFLALADLAALPVALYSGRGGEGISIRIVGALSGHPKITGMVDAAAEASRVKALVDQTASVRREVTVTSVFTAVTRRMIAKHRPAAASLVSPESLSEGRAAVAAVTSPPSALKTRTKTVGFQVLCGSGSGILDSLGAGATGAMPPLAACAPQACYEVLAAWKDGDAALAAEKQERLRDPVRVVEGELGVAALKYASDLNGYFGGRSRLPGLPLTGEERARVEAVLSGLRN